MDGAKEGMMPKAPSFDRSDDVTVIDEKGARLKISSWRGASTVVVAVMSPEGKSKCDVEISKETARELSRILAKAAETLETLEEKR